MLWKSIESRNVVRRSDIKEHDPLADVLIDGTETEEQPKKIRIKDGVDFYPIHQEVKYIDPKTGKLITESLKDFSKKTIISVNTHRLTIF
jgi:hypothetical protein